MKAKKKGHIIFFHGMFEDPDRCLRYFNGKEWKGYEITIPDLEHRTPAQLRKYLSGLQKNNLTAIGHSAGCAWLLHATRGLDIRKILMSPVVEYSQMPWGYRIYRKIHIRSDRIYRYLIRHYCNKLGADLTDMKTWLPSSQYLYLTRNLLKKGPILDGELISVICRDDPVVGETPESLKDCRTEYLKGQGHGLSMRLMKHVKTLF